MQFVSSFKCILQEIARPSMAALGLSVMTALLSIDASSHFSSSRGMLFTDLGCVGTTGPIWCSIRL